MTNQTTSKNLFVSVLTYAAPSANYRGESEENRTVLQKITRGNLEFTVISPEAIRNALRESLAAKGLPMNRSRLHDQEQLAVKFEAFPDASKYADDFLFGFMVADKKAIEKNGGKPSKRDSVLRMNLAVALMPYRFNATFHQSPLNTDSPWKNSSTSALIHREVVHTAYQFPFALAGSDCTAGDGPEWTRALLASIGELNDVAGGHARSYFEMAPRSLVARLTPSLVAGFDTYGFDEEGEFPELARVLSGDLPGSEFWLAGEIVRKLATDQKKNFESKGVRLLDNPQLGLAQLADSFLARS